MHSVSSLPRSRASGSYVNSAFKQCQQALQSWLVACYTRHFPVSDGCVELRLMLYTWKLHHVGASYALYLHYYTNAPLGDFDRCRCHPKFSRSARQSTISAENRTIPGNTPSKVICRPFDRFPPTVPVRKPIKLDTLVPTAFRDDRHTS